MKALTIWQPWASLCVEPRYAGTSATPFKTIETRSWKAPTALIGERIAIHAAKRTVTEEDLAHIGLTRRTTDTGDDWLTFEGRDAIALPLPTGVIVGTAILADCVPMVDPDDHADVDGERVLALCPVISPRLGGLRFWTTFTDATGHGTVIEDCEDQRPFGDFAPGRFAWLLTNVERFDTPQPATGRQGLWNWEPPIAV